MRRAVARRILETGGLSLARSGERHRPALPVTVPPYGSCRYTWRDYTAESCTPGRAVLHTLALLHLTLALLHLHGACIWMFFRHSFPKAEWVRSRHILAVPAFEASAVARKQLQDVIPIDSKASERFRQSKWHGERSLPTRFQVGSGPVLCDRENRLRSNRCASPQLHQG